MAHGFVGKRRWTQASRRPNDREELLPRAKTPIEISRLNLERKVTGRSGRAGKKPTGSERQSGGRLPLDIMKLYGLLQPFAVTVLL